MSFRSGLARLNKPLLLALLLFATIAAALGWKYYKERYPSWYEEVRLSDGRIITIHQKRQHFKNYGTNQSWVTIDLPELGGKKVWHSYLMPMRVDVVNGEVYVFGRPRGPRQVSIYRYPKHHMVAFKWSGAEFLRVPYLSVPAQIRAEENVYSCIPTANVDFLKLIQKDEFWCPPSGDKHQFTKKINETEYKELAKGFARLDGGNPIAD